MFGNFGKAIGGGFKNMGKAMTGKGGGVNAGPSGGFMSRFKTAAPMALNNAAQIWGGPTLGNMAKMTRGMMQPPQGGMARPQVQGPNGEAPSQTGISTGPSPMANILPAAGMMAGRFGEMMGGNTGINGGWWNPNRPRLDPSTNQYTMPDQSQSIFSRIYGGGGADFPSLPGRVRPQIYT